MQINKRSVSILMFSIPKEHFPKWETLLHDSLPVRKFSWCLFDLNEINFAYFRKANWERQIVHH